MRSAELVAGRRGGQQSPAGARPTGFGGTITVPNGRRARAESESWTRTSRRAPPTVGIKLKRQVLPELYARQAVGAYHSKAHLIK